MLGLTDIGLIKFMSPGELNDSFRTPEGGCRKTKRNIKKKILKKELDSENVGSRRWL
jgi:hypothetical protein